ncbi:MAG TPA: class II aldolase/adducin family protein [Solirubrobacteraceae bacterium]|jgi:L-fuculose-phosphate aldolase|nr:class II aldolase/adducin family protein [Solirubrobacteraceae bacterium]
MTLSRETDGELRRLIDGLVEAARGLADAGLVSGSSGNLSARTGGLIAVSATGARLSRLDAEQVTVVDLDGRVLRGGLAPTSELALHLEIYRRYDPGAIVHAHPPVATALSCVLDELPCIHPDMLDLGGTVRVAAYETFGSHEFAEITASALEDRRAVLMSNHGTVAIGNTPEQAADRTRLLEWAAGLYWRASLLGPPRVLSGSQQEELRAMVHRIGYGQLRPLEP